MAIMWTEIGRSGLEFLKELFGKHPHRTRNSGGQIFVGYDLAEEKI